MTNSGGKFPSKTLSSKVQSRKQFCSEKQPLQSSSKSRAERDFVSRNDPPKLSEVQTELDFILRSDLSKALRSQERKAILFQEATDSLR